MSAWIIYDKNGLAKCETRKLEYQGEFMGACSVNVSITSPTPIGFELGDWLEYRGERFELNYDPSVVKESSSNTYGEGFQYENIVFNSLADELTRCDFLDYVPNDNEIHYSSLPTFSFFADSITKLAERIQANLDRIYKGDKKWTVEVHPEYVNTLNVNITANNNTVWDALGFVNTMFGANFIIRGRKITIGTTGLAVGQLFSYGKGNGLYKIERNAESSQKVITRLRAYGSTRNMPTDYYHNVSGGNIPNNMAVKNLMLPSFPAQTHDPYIDSKNIEELGVREGTVFFDGSSELEEIYPTMEGMTAEDLRQAGITVNATGRLDEVLSSEQISDNGKFEDGASIPDFTIHLKDVGFDLNDYLGTSSATISMKDGMCGGREFEIVKCEKESNGYKLTCHRHYDESLDLYFPYNSYQIKGGDKFVLLNIEMPDAYIKAASQRLLNAATAYLAKNDYVRYGYTLSVDNIFMAKQHDEAVKSGITSIHDIIKEGDLMLFEDEDLGIEGSITIASLNIKENADESIIPEYEITLQDEKTVGTLDKIQNQIANLAANGIGGSVSFEQVESILKTVGGKYFLSKTKDDRSKGIIASNKGIEVGRYIKGLIGGSGGKMYLDENKKSVLEVDKIQAREDVTVNKSVHSTEFISGFTSGKGWAVRMKEYLNSAGVTENRSVAEFDDLIVRGTMRVFEFIVSQMLGENDNRTFTGMMEVDHYDEETGKVWLDTQDGKLYNTFRKDDIILVQQYNSMPSEENNFYVTKQYELIITEVGVGDMSLGEDRLDWVKFRNLTTPMDGSYKDIITKGDTFVRIDNLTDPNRKGIIQIMTVGEDTPYMDVIYGKKTDPENALKSRFGNLQGIYNHLFGWLKDFGAYIANLYAVGEFRIAHTGEDVADKIEMVKGAFRTNFSKTYFEMKDEANYLFNGSFSGDLEGWVLGESNTDFLLVGGVAVYANRNLMTANTKFAGRAVYNDMDMLRIFNSDVKQLNSTIKKFGTHKEYLPMAGGESEPSYEFVEKPDKAYLIMKFYCASDGEVEIGFDNGDNTADALPFVTIAVSKQIGEYLVQEEGVWNNKGNFVIRSTADIYIEFVTLYDRPLENMQTTTETWMEQDAGRIALLGQKIDETNRSVTDLGIELDAERSRIDLYVTKTQNLESTTRSLESRITLGEARIDAVAGSIETDAYGNITNISTSGLVLDSEFARLFSYEVNDQGIATSAELDMYVLSDDLDYLVSKIEISADQINLSGAVTYSDLSDNLQDELDGKATSAELAALRTNLNSSISTLNSTVDSLQDEVDEKATTKALTDYVTQLTNSINDKANKNLSNAVVNGYTFIYNGLIRTNFIDVDNIVAKQLEATDGTYTFTLDKNGFTIEHPSASNYLWSLRGDATYGSDMQMYNRSNSRWVYLKPGHLTIAGTGNSFVVDLDSNYVRMNDGMVIRNFGVTVDYDFMTVSSTSYSISGVTKWRGRVLFIYFSNECSVSGLASGTVKCKYGTTFICNGSSWYHFASKY